MRHERRHISFLPFNSRICDKVELRPKQCIDTVLKPLLDNIDIQINGSLTIKDLFYTAICMVVDNSPVHSASKHYQEIPSETSLIYRLKKLNLAELIEVNESILLQAFVSTLKSMKKYKLAIDFTNDPYYGTIDSSNESFFARKL